MNGRQWLRWLVVLGCLVCLPVKSYALLETMSAVLQNTVSDAAVGSDMNVTGYNTVLVEVTITGSATITFRGSGAGSAYTDLACVNITSTTGITTTTATATGIYRCSVAGLNIFRVPITTYGSGTVRAFARVTTGGGGGGSGGSGGTYVASPPTLTDGESAALLLDSSGRIVMSLGTCLSGESACIGDSPNSYIMVAPVARALGGATILRYISVGTTEDEHAVCTAACTLYSVTVTNVNAAVRYLKCNNATAANTAPGTDVPELDLAVPGATTGAGITFPFPVGAAFDTALTCWLVTGAAESDVAEVAANELKVLYTYKQ